jgi:non-heme chloroperoxidase
MTKHESTRNGFPSRRDVLIGVAAMAAAPVLPTERVPYSAEAFSSTSQTKKKGENHMSTITGKDGTTIYYKDWNKGPVVTFSHGWPLSSDAWDGQMLFLAQNGFRVVAHDRRGHGRSSQSSTGNDMDGYADDLAAVIEALDLKDATLVGHSTGGGEVARYIGRYGTKRVARAVLVAAVPPIMVKSAANPEGLPIEVFDNLRSAITKDRSQFYKDLAPMFYGANRPGAKVSQGTLDQFWLWSMQAGLKNAYESIKAFSETDFTEDLKQFDVPTLVMHGEDDQIVPVKDSARKSARLIKGAKEIYYPGAPHGLTATHQDQVNADLLAFLGRPQQKSHVA